MKTRLMGLIMGTALAIVGGFAQIDASPIHDAAAKNDIEGVLYELNRGVDVNVKNSDRLTPLMVATMWGCTAVVKVLLAANADVTLIAKSEGTALDMAMKWSRPEIAQLIQDHLDEIAFRLRGYKTKSAAMCVVREELS